jgi:hypothetical protein
MRALVQRVGDGIQLDQISEKFDNPRPNPYTMSVDS